MEMTKPEYRVEEYAHASCMPPGSRFNTAESSRVTTKGFLMCVPAKMREPIRQGIIYEATELKEWACPVNFFLSQDKLKRLIEHYIRKGNETNMDIPDFKAKIRRDPAKEMRSTLDHMIHSTMLTIVNDRELHDIAIKHHNGRPDTAGIGSNTVVNGLRDSRLYVRYRGLPPEFKTLAHNAITGEVLHYLDLKIPDRYMVTSENIDDAIRDFYYRKDEACRKKVEISNATVGYKEIRFKVGGQCGPLNKEQQKTIQYMYAYGASFEAICKRVVLLATPSNPCSEIPIGPIYESKIVPWTATDDKPDSFFDAIHNAHKLITKPEKPMHPVAPAQPMNTSTPARNLNEVFGIVITGKTKETIMAMIRQAKSEVEAFADLDQDSAYVKSQTKTINAGIKKLYAELDK